MSNFYNFVYFCFRPSFKSHEDISHLESIVCFYEQQPTTESIADRINRYFIFETRCFGGIAECTENMRFCLSENYSSTRDGDFNTSTTI